MKKRINIVIATLLILLAGCRSAKKETMVTSDMQKIESYSRTRILSYPAPGDLKMGDGLRLPTLLNKGYLLDNKGIGPNVAFLTYTYEEYSQLPTAPSMTDLMSHILDKYPLLEIRACGRRADYKDIVIELNEKIAEGFLQK